MTSRNDGGPAFPMAWHPEMGWSPRGTPEGISMRDYFAARAPWICGPMDSQEQDAKARYKWADAMLKAREGGAS